MVLSKDLSMLRVCTKVAWLPKATTNSVERIEEMCELRAKTLTEEEMAHLEEAYVT